MNELPLLFQPLRIRALELKNRVVISPMMQHAADGGSATAWHLVHLGKLVLGGAALVFTESTAVSSAGRIGKADLGLWSDAHIAPLQAIVAFAHANNAAIGVQLGHAGRKAGSQPLWEGGAALDPDQMAELDATWVRSGPSPISAGPGWSQPVEMDHAAIEQVISDFTSSARRADEAGFDAIELHFGHGYLVASFLSTSGCRLCGARWPTAPGRCPEP